MKIQSYSAVTVKGVDDPEAKGVRMSVVISREDGAENFIMRVFQIVPEGHTPKHRHDWEHEVFILAGRGIAFSESGEHEVKQGDVIFIPPNEEHQFRNPGPENLEFICLIPAKTG